MQIPEPFSFILTWFAAIPFILWLAQSITRAIVQDFLILKVKFLLHCLLYIKPIHILFNFRIDHVIYFLHFLKE